MTTRFMQKFKSSRLRLPVIIVTVLFLISCLLMEALPAIAAANANGDISATDVVEETGAVTPSDVVSTPGVVSKSDVVTSSDVASASDVVSKSDVASVLDTVRKNGEQESTVGSVTFYYTGSDRTASELWFYVSYAVSTQTTASAGSLADFGISGPAATTYDGYSAVTLTGDRSVLSSVWISFGFEGQIGNVPVAFNGAAVEVEAVNVYGTNTFVYVGETEGVTAGDIWFYVSYIVSQSNSSVTAGALSDFGITSTVGTTDGYSSVTLRGCLTDLSSGGASVGIGGTTVSSWTPLTFDGTVYYVSDSAVSTTPPTVPKTDYSFNVHCYGDGYQIGGWMALVEGGTETAWSPSAEAITTSFTGYDGEWSSAALAWSYPDDFNRLTFQIGQSSPWESSSYNYDFSGAGGEIWIIPGDSRVFTSLEEAEEVINGGGATPTYSFTVHCYGDGYQIGGWLALVKGGSETAWSPSNEAVNTSFADYDGEWSTVKFSWFYTDEFNRLAFQIGKASPWESTVYNFDFTGTGGEIWVVPGDPEVYTKLKDAEKAINSSVKSTTIVFHYNREAIDGWTVGTWFTAEQNGSWGSRDTQFTYKDSWGYVAVVKYDVKVASVGFMMHQNVMYDGIAKDWYKTDGRSSGTVNIKGGYAEVWVSADKGFTTECPRNATLFKRSSARSCYVPRYYYLTTKGGIDATIVFHYYRADRMYGSWKIGAWAARISGKYDEGTVEFEELDDDFAAVGKLSLKKWPVQVVEFVPFYAEWEKMDGEIKYLKRKDILANLDENKETHVYIYEGDEEIYFERQKEKYEADAATDGEQQEETTPENDSGSTAVLGATYTAEREADNGGVVRVLLICGGAVVFLSAAGAACFLLYKRNKPFTKSK